MARQRAKSLDTNSQRRVLVELLALGERHWEFVATLQQAGWDVVDPRLDFEVSFAESEEERSEFRRYVVESTKISLANPNIRFRLPEGEPHSTEYMDHLRRRRDEQFKSSLAPGQRPLWMNELDPCLRRMEQLRYADRAVFSRRFESVQAEEKQRRVHETARHASGMSREFSGELDRPARFYRAVMERETRPLGFTSDAGRSTSDRAVLSKELIDGWDLCLSPEPLAWFPGRNDGQAVTILSLQDQHHRKPVERAKWDQVLIVEHTKLVRHFDHLYTRFASLDELEVILMARMYLLSLVIKDIEAGLLVGLANVV
ncbi:hypothetical protein HL667_25025 [Bradyrhizobium sp. 83012]|uniref:Uncharacterized protein n=1 Tax=Bradyrhizobium aeschynomenes TaxID=2734909 RepID=A0ABX2CLY5_9BRAD|nr:hypothetical protein [Bradyrhizobium aeschynomenes]NPU68287.1 hypothetical protein [Bradyrhizobium aeschynomenes]